MDKKTSDLTLLIDTIRAQFDEIERQYNRVYAYVGLSGGPDSVALLHLLTLFQHEYPQKLKLKAIHVNHGLSSNAKNWQDFVEHFCSLYSVPCISQAVQVSSNANIEANARDARYAVFQKIVQSQDQIKAGNTEKELNLLVLGHHADDMAEQFFLGLMRAAGPQGLSGNQIFEDHYLGFPVWRPLLDFSRETIELYLSDQQLESVTDESNDDTHFSRNYIRHELMPQMRRRWPHAVKSIRQTQNWCAEAVQLADDLAQIDYERCLFAFTPAAIPAVKSEYLLEIPEYRAKNLLRHFLKSQGVQQIRGTLWTSLLENLNQTQVSSKSGQQIKVCVDFAKSLFLGHFSGGIYLFKENEPAAMNTLETSQIAEVERCFGVRIHKTDLMNKNGFLYDQSALSFQESYPGVLSLSIPSTLLSSSQNDSYDSYPNLIWRLAEPQDKLHLPTKPYAMTLKKLWLEWNVPKFLRSRWPVLVDQENNIKCIPGIWCDTGLCHNG